ncbi:MAG TPA: hypothetical protein VH186_33310 [Chloroflexia bacterium]|nr:hypothetical protein [Chloroflexia bacterium]
MDKKEANCFLVRLAELLQQEPQDQVEQQQRWASEVEELIGKYLMAGGTLRQIQENLPSIKLRDK